MKQFSLFASVCLVASMAGTVVAQMPDVPACVMTCTTQAASDAKCSSNMDLPCVCTSAEFAASATKCILAQCTAEEVNTASQLQQTVCAPYASGSAGASSNSVAATGSASTTSTAAGSSSTSTNSASGNKQASAGLGLLALGAGAALFAL